MPGSIPNVQDEGGSVNSPSYPAESSSDPSVSPPESAAPHPAVRGDQSHGKASEDRCGRSASARSGAGSTPPSAPGSEGDLDLYRVTHESGADRGAVRSESFPVTGDDCPYPIEIGVDEWDTATGELVDAGIALLPCGRKGCPVCGPRIRDRYVAHYARVFSELGQDRPIWFLTLTVDAKVLPEDAGEQEARKYLVHCWDKYAKRLRYRADDLKYAGAFELHRSGDRWHLHVIVAADFPGRDSEGAVREMMRVQWFESGGGAVGKVKRVREDRTDPSSDGTPDGIAGSVGYVVKYAFKDAAEAHSAAESRRSMIASQGIGYHSKEAKEHRREHTRAESEREGGTVREYHSLVDPKPGEGRDDTLTDEDRERFERWDKSVRTLEYRERIEDSDRWDGRTVWVVWKMDADAGTLRRTVFDGWPDSESTAVLEPESRVRSSDP